MMEELTNFFKTLHGAMNVKRNLYHEVVLLLDAMDDLSGARIRSGAVIAPTTLHSVDPNKGSWTMMQPCASAAKLRGGGSVLWGGLESHGFDRCTTASDRHRSAHRARQTSAETVCDCQLVDLVNHDAGRITTPCGTSPVVTNRHSAMSSLRASATTMVLGFLSAATPA
jgi:hypothetical protein